jgi:hypothetical protein
LNEGKEENGMIVHVTERASKSLEQWLSPEQPDVYLRLMMIMEGG